MAEEEVEQLEQGTGGEGTGTGTGEAAPTPGSNESLLENFMKDTDGPARGTVRGPAGEAGQGAAGAGQGKPGAGGKEGAGAPAKGGAGAGGTEGVQQVPQAARQYGNLFLADQRGDIYDARGNLLAKQGYGRSIFHKLYPYIEAASTENAALKTRVENYERAQGAARDAGLTIDDHGAAMQLMVNWKKNPLETLNTLLRVASDRGIDVSAIKGGGGVDLAALRQTIREEVLQGLQPFQPFVEQQQTQREQQEAMEVVGRQYNEFMTEFPDAVPHQLSIANVMRDHDMTHREAYFALKAFAAERRLDFSQDLRPQLDAMARQPGNGQGAPSGSGIDRNLPAMNGRANGAGTVETGSRSAASPDESWDAITRRTFAQHGIDIP